MRFARISSPFSGGRGSSPAPAIRLRCLPACQPHGRAGLLYRDGRRAGQAVEQAGAGDAGGGGRGAQLGTGPWLVCSLHPFAAWAAGTAAFLCGRRVWVARYGQHASRMRATSTLHRLAVPHHMPPDALVQQTAAWGGLSMRPCCSQTLKPRVVQHPPLSRLQAQGSLIAVTLC